MKRANSTDPSKVAQSILTMKHETSIGSFTWDGKGASQWVHLIYQFQNEVKNKTSPQIPFFLTQIVFVFFSFSIQELQIIAPIQTSSASLVFPFVPWDGILFCFGSYVLMCDDIEREVDESPFSGLEVFILCLVCVLSLISVGGIIGILLLRKNDVILAASPVFLILISVGSVLLYVSTIFFLPSFISEIGCTLRVWLLGE